MADKIVTQDPTNPGVLKVNGPTLGPGNKILLSELDTTGAVNGNAIELVAGVWTPGSPSSSDTASNLGAGNGVFSAKVGSDFRFKSLIAGTGITITPTANDLTIARSGGGAFTAGFASSLQAITSAGGLTIAHGLGGTPILVEAELVNQIANAGYSPGDIVPINHGQTESSVGTGVAIIPDATNLNIRYGGAGVTMLTIIHKATGAGESIIVADWQMRFRAWI